MSVVWGVRPVHRGSWLLSTDDRYLTSSLSCFTSFLRAAFSFSRFSLSWKTGYILLTVSIVRKTFSFQWNRQFSPKSENTFSTGPTLPTSTTSDLKALPGLLMQTQVGLQVCMHMVFFFFSFISCSPHQWHEFKHSTGSHCLTWLLLPRLVTTTFVYLTVRTFMVPPD